MARGTLPGARWNGHRDLKLLHALGRAVLLTVAQVRLVGGFGSREAAARRMRKLARLGYVQIWKSKDKTEHARYGVTDAGKERLLEEDAEIAPERIHVAKGVLRGDLEHLARLADVRIAVGAATYSRSDVALVDYFGDADLRQVVEQDGERLIPDAFMILETVTAPLHQLGVWIEVDRGTTGIRRFAEKLTRLAGHIAAGSPVLGVTRWAVAALAERERRRQTIARAAGSTMGEGIWLATIAAFVADPFGPVLRSASGANAAIGLPDLFQRGVPAAGTSVAADS